MITSYTYKITSTNPDLAAMTVEFSAPDYPTVEVGARMPFVGESMSDLIASIAPIGYWLDSKKAVAAVSVGTPVSVVIPAVTPPEPPVAGPPTRVTKFQAKAALLGAGLLAWTARIACDSGLSSAGLMHATYGSTFAAIARVRNGSGGTPIVPFETTLSITAAGASANAVRTSDV